MLDKLRSDQSGMSLVEIALTLVVVGLMTVPMYTLFFHVTKIGPNDERLKIIQESLAEHLRVTGTLPCPANPADSGANEYTASANATGCNVTGGMSSESGVIIGSLPIDNLNATLGCSAHFNLQAVFGNTAVAAIKDNVHSVREIITGNDENADSSPKDTSRAEDIKCLVKSYQLDEYGNKFIYAVTEAATVPGFDMFDPDVGQIRVVNESGARATARDQVYVLVSTGEDRFGGYNQDSNLIACNPTQADGENCDGDDTFIASTRFDSTEATSYDDFIDFGFQSFLSEVSMFSFGEIDAGNRDVVIENAQLEFGDGVVGADIDDLLRISGTSGANGGGMGIDGSLNLRKRMVIDDSDPNNLRQAPSDNAINIEDGTLNVDEGLSLDNVGTAPKFCYDPPMTGDC